MRKNFEVTIISHYFEKYLRESQNKTKSTPCAAIYLEFEVGEFGGISRQYFKLNVLPNLVIHQISVRGVIRIVYSRLCVF